MINLYISTYHKYNSGTLAGEWVELPQTAEELSATLNRIAKLTPREEPDNCEFMIQDFETDLNIKIEESDDNGEISTKVMGCEAAPVVQLKDKDSRTHEYLKRVWQCLEKHHWLNSNAMQFFKDAGYWHGEQLSLF